MAELVKEKNTKVTMVEPSESDLLNARLDRLMVVYRNLLDNAIKCTQEGDTVVWNLQNEEGGLPVSSVTPELA